MDATRKRTLFRVGIILVAGLAALGWAISTRSRTFIVENHSGQRIERLSVTVSGQTSNFEDVPIEGQVSGTFKSGSDDRFDIEGRLAGGTRIHANGKAGEHFHFLILPGGDVRIRTGKERGS